MAKMLPLLLLLTLSAAARAQFTTGTSNGKLTITGYSGPGGAVVIPSTINGLPVTAIGSMAFRNCANVTRVEIPSSVITIGDEAFEYCSNLTSVTIPNGVTMIGTLCFYACANLTSVAIPGSVASIGAGAFEYCTGLSVITVSDSNLNYSSSVDDVLFNKSKTTLIKYPAGKPNINYIIPGTVISIAKSAFSQCWSLSSVFIPNDVTSIGDNGFYNCTSLTAVRIPNTVTSIGSFAFYRCVSLTGVTIPNGVAKIGYSAFENTSLTSVTIPSTVTNIAEAAFRYCSRLKHAFFAGNAPTMGLNVFDSAGSGFAVNFLNASSGFTTPTWHGYTTLGVNSPSTNANVWALTITQCALSPVFTSTGTNYTATVPNSVTSVTVTPSLTDSKGTVQVTGAAKLIVGNNTITVTATAEDATTTKKYTVVVKRRPSANADLSALAITSGAFTPPFVWDGFNYAATVPNNVTAVGVMVTVADATAMVQIDGGSGLVVGSNIININVTAQDGTTANLYRIFVTREPAPVAVNDTVLAHGTTVTFDPRANDKDPSGHPLLVASTGVGKFGTVTRTGTSITYQPGANYAGNDSFLYTISNAFGGSASATVTITEPSVTLSGTYRGILSVGGTGSGFCIASVGVARDFSATVYLYAEKYVIAGTFNPQGYFVQPIALVGGGTLKVALRLVPNTNLLTGTFALNATTWSASLARTYPAYSAMSPTPFAGRYTVLFPLNPALLGQAAYPQGTGYATLVVSNDGTATLAGKLGDGT
ncbi:MAG: leucine-rich repeat protein, partial [Verrucomicrobiota bacterium]